MSKGCHMDPPAVIVDLSTQTASKGSIAYEPLPAITVKGSTGLIDIFVPADVRSANSRLLCDLDVLVSPAVRPCSAAPSTPRKTTTTH